MSADVSTLVNTGFIIVRNSRWSLKFLRDWVACKDRPGVLNEQLGFEAVYKDRGSREMEERVAILSPEVLNSVAPAMGEQQPQHQVGLAEASRCHFELSVTFAPTAGAASSSGERRYAASSVPPRRYDHVHVLPPR
jgi:hypothetical protein